MSDVKRSDSGKPDLGRQEPERPGSAEPGASAPGAVGPAPAGSLNAAEALKRLEATIQRTAALVRQLRADNERLTRQNRELEQRARAARLDSERQLALHSSLASGAGGDERVAELAGQLAELEQQRREWLRDRRRLADRVEGILDKLEFLQSESSAN